MKLTRNEQARIRYQLLREAGYSVKDAQRMRYVRAETNPEYIDIKTIKVDRKTKKVIKKDIYKTTLNTINLDERMSNLKVAQDQNDTVFTYHGYLTRKVRRQDDNAEWRYLRNEYYELVKTIKRYDKLTNDQAYFMAHYMLANNVDYKIARRELLTNQDFQKYIQSKKKRIRIEGRKTHSRSKNYQYKRSK